MKILLPLLALLLFGCSQAGPSDTRKATNIPENVSDAPKVDESFQRFLAKFPKVELPVYLKGCELNYQDFTRFETESPHSYGHEGSFAYGQIQTNGAYVSVITLGAADCLLPIITTYQPNGKKIDSKTIAIGYCGEAPCFECSEFMTIGDDFTLYTADTLRSFDCDEDYMPIAGTEQIEVIFKQGRFTQTGKLELSEEMKKEVN